MKTIEIKIGKNGEVSMESFNFGGSSCEEVLQKVAEQLGVLESEQKKPEYYLSSHSYRDNEINLT